MPAFDVIKREMDETLEILIPKNYIFTEDDVKICSRYNKLRLVNNMKNDNDYGAWSGSLDWIPDNITHLTLPETYNEPINKFPKELKVLYVNTLFNRSLENLPEGIEEVICNNDSRWNQSAIFPSTLKYLKLGMYFNQCLDNLPKGLKTLIIESNIFDKIIDNLPPNLEYLSIISNIFNKPLDNLPINLKYLYIFSCVFNHPLDYLPSNLTYLYIESTDFTQQLSNLPSSLIKLYIITASDFDYPLCNLPVNLEELMISNNYNHPLVNLPVTLKKLIFVSGVKPYIWTFENLPVNLESLYIKILCVDKNIISTIQKQIELNDKLNFKDFEAFSSTIGFMFRDKKLEYLLSM